jgi:hypothetical protein
LDVGLEGLSEDGDKLLDMLLETNEVRIKSEHVVNTLVFETLNVDGLILLQLDKVSDFMLFWHNHSFLS